MNDDLDEVAVISNAAPESVRYGSGHHTTANGPRVVPGIITAGMDRTKVLTSSLPPANLIQKRPSTVISTTIVTGQGGDNQCMANRCTSRQSLIGTELNKVNVGPNVVSTSAYLGNGKDTDNRKNVQTVEFVNKALVTNEPEVSKKMRDLRRKEIKKEFEKWETASSIRPKSGCNWSFVFDPSGRLCYYWSMIVSIAFLYNFWSIIYRCAFQEINENTVLLWFSLDYFADFIYVLDIAVNFRTGYLEEGVLQTNSLKLRQHYMNCTLFYIDLLCLLPLDFLYLSIGFKSILRCFRLVKIYRFWAFLDRTERHTNYPNVFRTLSLIHYILVIFHWNACLSHIIHIKDGFGSRDWFTRSKNKTDCEGVTCDYLHAMYWSVLALTTIGDLPMPRTKSEYSFLFMQLVFGLFLFATVLGHVANIVTNVSAARKEFQAKLDAVKTYMRMRRVPDHIQTKVIRWFDYLWMTQKSSDEERSVGCLPDKLKAEIAIHVHLDTLKRVEIFQNTEAGFLCELVLRLRPVLFSPGDYICRKGEVGKEMYIVNRGRLQVVTDNGKTVLATLRAGSYFGEISILNMGTAGNRRTASVRSVGYSDLFCLNKQDMWDVLKDYPAARVRLEAIAVKRLEKYRKEPLKKIAMGRSRSTPGLVESKGKVPVSDSDIQQKEHTSASTATLVTDEDNEKTLLAEKDDGDMTSLVSEDTSTIRGSKTAVPKSITPQQFAQIIPGQSALIYPAAGAHLLAPNVTLMNFDNRNQQAGLYPSAQIPFYTAPSQQYSPFCGLSPAASTNHLSIPSNSACMGTPSPNYVSDDNSAISMQQQQQPPPPPPQSLQSVASINSQQSQEALMSEIKRLRERLITVETENASMSMKLSQQHWQVENRLTELEMQICSATSGNTCSAQLASASSASSNASGEDNERNKESII